MASAQHDVEILLYGLWGELNLTVVMAWNVCECA